MIRFLTSKYTTLGWNDHFQAYEVKKCPSQQIALELVKHSKLSYFLPLHTVKPSGYHTMMSWVAPRYEIGDLCTYCMFLKLGIWLFIARGKIYIFLDKYDTPKRCIDHAFLLKISNSLIIHEVLGQSLVNFVHMMILVPDKVPGLDIINNSFV